MQQTGTPWHHGTSAYWLIAPSTPPPLSVTCSVGWDVVAADTAASLDMVLSSADHRLYDAKRSGRDRACGPLGAIDFRRNG